MADDEFTCDLFRFLQLLCEGHNNGENPGFSVEMTEFTAVRWTTNVPFSFCCRFSELLADTNRKHDHHQCHHLHCRLPPTTPGAQSHSHMFMHMI